MTPTPHNGTLENLTGAVTRNNPARPNRIQGPLVLQTEPAARLATILHHAAQELWDTCTYDDSAQMWEEARAIASRILASCPL